MSRRVKICFNFVLLGFLFTTSSSSTSEVKTETVTLVLIACENHSTANTTSWVNSTQCGEVPLKTCEKLMSFDRQQNQIRTMLKSVLITWVHGPKTLGKQLLVSHPELNRLDVIIFGNNRSIFDEISNEVAKWNQKYTHFLTLKFRDVEYSPEFGWMLEKYRPCSSYRAYFPEQLARTDPGLKRVIYLDTDMLILKDIRHLWRTFDEFKEPMLVAALNASWNYHRIMDVVLALNQSKSIEFKFKEETIVINPGILLVNLDNWKSDNWVHWMKAIQNELTLAKCPDKAGISTYLSMNNEQYFRLNLTWNFGTHCLYKYKHPQRHPACVLEEPGVSILHGYGGTLVFNTRLRLPKLLFSHFEDADLIFPISPATFVNSLLSKAEMERRRCIKIKSQLKRYCKHFNISSMNLLYNVLTLS